MLPSCRGTPRASSFACSTRRQTRSGAPRPAVAPRRCALRFRAGIVPGHALWLARRWPVAAGAGPSLRCVEAADRSLCHAHRRRLHASCRSHAAWRRNRAPGAEGHRRAGAADAAAACRRRRPGFIYEVAGQGLHHAASRTCRRRSAARWPRWPNPASSSILKRLGVDTVELMPLAAWIDERHLPPLGLANAWGYNPVTFMAPDPRLAPGGLAEIRADRRCAS